MEVIAEIRRKAWELRIKRQSALIRPEPECGMVITIYSTNILKHPLCAKTHGGCWDTMTNMLQSPPKVGNLSPGSSVEGDFKRAQVNGHQFFE